MATSAHTEHPGGGKPQFPPFNKETFASQLVWFVIFFVALYVIISRLAIPRIGGIIEARRSRDRRRPRRGQPAQGAIRRGAAGLREVAGRRARPRAGAGQRDPRQAQRRGRRAPARRWKAELNAKLAEAEKTIAATKTAAMANVRGIAVDTAAAIVERLIGTAPPASAVEAAVADALKR